MFIGTVVYSGSQVIPQSPQQVVVQQIIQGPLVQHQIIAQPGGIVAQPGGIVNQPGGQIIQPGASGTILAAQPGSQNLIAQPGGQILQPGSIVMGPNGSIRIINNQQTNLQQNLSAGQVRHTSIIIYILCFAKYDICFSIVQEATWILLYKKWMIIS